MVRAVTFIMFVFCYSQASAQNCPDFYRFVDFGLEGNDSKIYRGGINIRAESFDGHPLLIPEKTKCRVLREISKDGHGNPIPVVTSVNYNPARMDFEVQELKVSYVSDTAVPAKENANAHQKRIKSSGSKTTKGSDFLCVSFEGQHDLSCQLVSPYSGNTPLVVHCDTTKCTLPVLAIDKRLQASAVWTIEKALLDKPDAAGKKISNMIQKIHNFLKPLSAAL